MEFARMSLNYFASAEVSISKTYHRRADGYRYPSARRNRPRSQEASKHRENLFSLVLKLSHPLRPVCGYGAAGFGPMAACVKVPMPFQCP